MKCMEKARPVTALRKAARRSDRSPLHDVRHHARRPKANACGFVFSRTSAKHSFNCIALIAQRQMNDAVWWSQTGSNRRPPACKAGALPTELWPLASGVLMSELPACGAVARGNRHRPASSPACADASARQLRLATRAKAGGPGKI
jgi:hypothetical protein